MSGLLLTKLDYLEAKTTKTYIAKVYIQTSNDNNHVLDSNFAFNKHEIFEEKRVNLIKDGLFKNGLHTDKLTLSSKTGQSSCGPYIGETKKHNGRPN